jgi:hypothetical protein
MAFEVRCLDTYELLNKLFRRIGSLPGYEPKGGTMQNSHNAHSIATALGASSQYQSSLSKKTAELARCQCCDAALPIGLNFAPSVSAAAISCIVCGHQNQSSDSLAPYSRTGPLKSSGHPAEPVCKKDPN